MAFLNCPSALFERRIYFFSPFLMNRTFKVQIGDRDYLVDPAMVQAHSIFGPAERLCLPALKQQEIPFDDPNSEFDFLFDEKKPFLVTPAALAMYGNEVICLCLSILQAEANRYEGLSYLQVFEDGTKKENLWFIDDGEGGAVTALLPSDY